MENHDYISFKSFLFTMLSMFIGFKQSLLLSFTYSIFAHNNILSLPLFMFTLTWILFGFLKSILFVVISSLYLLSLKKQWFRDIWNNNLKETKYGMKIEAWLKSIKSYDIIPYVTALNKALDVAIKYLTKYIIQVPTVGPYIINISNAIYALTTGVIIMFEEDTDIPTITTETTETNKINKNTTTELPSKMDFLMKGPTKEEMKEMESMMKMFSSSNGSSLPPFPFPEPSEEEMRKMEKLFNLNNITG